MSDEVMYQCKGCGRVESFQSNEEKIPWRHCHKCQESQRWTRCGINPDPDSDCLLDEAKAVVEDRENRHGSIVETHRTIAEFWSVYLTAITGHDIDLDASHAADMLDLFKDARKATGERDKDTYRDGVGYNHCAWTCREAELEAGDDD